MKNHNICLLKLYDIYPSLNKATKKVAKYVLDHPEKIIKMSIVELAKKCGVSTFTIGKLCNELSLKGYKEFKIKLFNSVPLISLKNIHEKVMFNDNSMDIAKKVCSSHIQALKSTLSYQDQGVLSKAIDILSQAGKILFFGFAGSFRVAFDAEHKFFRLGINCYALSDSHMQVMYSSLLNPSDVVIIITNTGRSKELIETINIIRKTKAKIITITSYTQSPVAKLSDLVIGVKATETAYRNEPMEVRICQLYIIDILFVGVALNKKDIILRNLYKTRQSLEIKRVN